MAAIIVLAQAYGTSYSGYEGEVAKNIFYFIDQDSGLLSKTTNPLRVPDAGINYSFEVWLRCRLDFPPASKCFNFKVWYDSGMPASGFKITTNSDIVDAYVQPVDSPSSVGTRVDFITKNSELDSIPLEGTLKEIGDYSSYLVAQLEISAGAALGDYQISWVLQYDEV